MSKATRRSIRKDLEHKAAKRKHEEAESKSRQLNGFKPVTAKDMPHDPLQAAALLRRA